MYDDSEVNQIKIPPHSIEAEQSVLGAVLLNNEAWETVAELVGEDDFYRHDHQLIFRALKDQVADEQPLDVVTMAERLQKRAELDSIGGISYLHALASGTPSASNVKAYAGIVHERSVLRQMIAIGNDIADAAYNPGDQKSDQLLDRAESQVLGIADKMQQTSDGFQGIRSILANTVERIDEIFRSDSAITGVATGFDDFDAMTSGLQASDLVIVAGRPSMGKTTFSMNIAEHVAISGDKPVAIFSMEMPAEQLAMRMIASLGRVELQKIRTGTMTDADWPRITSAVTLLEKNSSIFIDDSAGLSPTEVRAKARRLKREHGLGLIVIDYLQLMQIKGGNGENRTAEISEISRSLKSLAKELEVPVVALSQLNRSLEQRTDKRPVMSDLRESGAIEQDADLIVFIYRDEVYNPESPDKGTAEILIRKQRNGPIGSCRVSFLGQYTRFENYTPDYYSGDMGG